MTRLFIMCPECCHEPEIRFYFDDDCYFMTLLGVVLQSYGPEDWASIDQVIDEKNISEIYIVQNFNCCFLETGAYHQEPRFDAKPEAHYIELRKKLVDFPMQSGALKIKLCELNIRDGFNHWLDNSKLIKEKYEAKEVAIRGAVVHKSDSKYANSQHNKGRMSIQFINFRGPDEVNSNRNGTTSQKAQFSVIKNG